MTGLEYRRASRLFVGDQEILAVPNLAICADLRSDSPLFLAHCDADWSTLATGGGEDSVEAMKALAERKYPGIAERWVDVNTTREQALAWWNSQSGGEKCAFCGRRAFEVARWIVGPSAIICNLCIDELHAWNQEGVARPSSGKE